MDQRSIRQLLDKQDWGAISRRLTDFAVHRSRSNAMGKDLAQAAIARVFAFDSTWDPETEPELLRYLMSVVNSLLWNERTSHAAQKTVTMDGKHARRTRAAAEAVSDPQAFSEDKAAETNLFTRRMALLTERFAGDPEVLRLVELMVEGIDSPREVCRVTGWTARTFDSTRLRMLRGAAKVARDIGGHDDEPALTATADDEDTEVA